MICYHPYIYMLYPTLKDEQLLYITVMINCSVPVVPQNGLYIPVLPTYRSGSNIQLFCNSGFELEGIAAQTCKQDGTWTTAVHSCKGNGWVRNIFFCKLPDTQVARHTRPEGHLMVWATVLFVGLKEGYPLYSPYGCRHNPSETWLVEQQALKNLNGQGHLRKVKFQ